ncbi:MAG TPA: DUF488 domain-containing protein [Steroidobacteraceae bacterium]|jgi:uncharacterized protein (DUF488 family)|nr:DUF488 domain-containing protein [Steroidobacteraceae bacterium]
MLPDQRGKTPATIWTIGHSTRPIEEFLDLLGEARINVVADVRSFPGSRKYPQYGKEALEATLAARQIGYQWLQALGGRRRASPDSPNTAWRNASFRGYADYMSGPEFERGLGELLKVASQARTAIMCAEAVWWRCHRSMIADALCARGIEAVHILDAKHSVVHPMTAPARIVHGELTYAAAEQH